VTGRSTRCPRRIWLLQIYPLIRPGHGPARRVHRGRDGCDRWMGGAARQTSPAAGSIPAAHLQRKCSGVTRGCTDTTRARGDQASAPRRYHAGGADSQVDSHSVGHWQLLANVSGYYLSTFHLARTSLDSGGRQNRGLQNRLRGAAEASWVRSIPIHPRHFSTR